MNDHLDTPNPQSDFANLGLEYWPFDLTPDLRGTQIWAGRPELKSNAERLVRRLKRTSSSSLNLLWADFGAGKTHTLLHIRQLIGSDTETSQFAIYAALPRQARTFADVYRAVVRNLSTTDVAQAFTMAESKVGFETMKAGVESVWPPVWAAVQALVIGNEAMQNTATAWLRAEQSIPSRDLQQIGVSSRIRSTDEAVFAFEGLVTLFRLAGYGRMYVMIDEFQRIALLRGAAQNDINAGLHGLFNAVHENLSVVLSFSFGKESNIKYFLNEELLSREDPRRLKVELMSADDGATFLRELVEQASNGDEPIYDSSVLTEIANALDNVGDITPRRLIKATGLLFGEASMDIEDGVIERIDSKYMQNILDSSVLQDIAEDGSADQ